MKKLLLVLLVPLLFYNCNIFISKEKWDVIVDETEYKNSTLNVNAKNECFVIRRPGLILRINLDSITNLNIRRSTSGKH
jgi:hypothetical protein